MPGRERRPAAGDAGIPDPPRSALTLRLVLAAFGFIICAGAAVTFAILDLPALLVVVAAGFAIIAVVDIAVIIARKHRGQPG